MEKVVEKGRKHRKNQCLGDGNMNDALNKKLDTLVQIILFCGGFFGGAERRTITFDGETILVKRECHNGMNPGEEELYEGMTKSVLISGIKSFHLENWKPKYVDPSVLDGTQWSLELQFSDGSRWKSGGSNDYPENYDAFMEFMKME